MRSFVTGCLLLALAATAQVTYGRGFGGGGHGGGGFHGFSGGGGFHGFDGGGGFRGFDGGGGFRGFEGGGGEFHGFDGGARDGGGFRGDAGFARPEGGFDPGFDRAAAFSRPNVDNFARPNVDNFHPETIRPEEFAPHNYNPGDFRGATRPTNDQIRGFLNLPENHPDFHPSADTRPGVRPNVNVNTGNINRTTINTAGHNAFYGPGRLDNGKASYDQRLANRTQWADGVRHDFNHLWYNQFTHNWWHNHPNWANHWWYNPDPYHWWFWADWGAISSWALSDWAYPVYFDYGNNIYYNGNEVYYGDKPVATAEQYAQQATQIADDGMQEMQSMPQPSAQTTSSDSQTASAESKNWLPLGVFALVQKEGEKTKPTMFFQLALNKNGVVGGNYYNSVSDAALPIAGAVDKSSQRACWRVGKKNQTVFETGVYNLTKNETPILAHLANGKTEQWYLIRLDAPKDQKSKTPSAPKDAGPPPAATSASPSTTTR